MLYPKKGRIFGRIIIFYGIGAMISPVLTGYLVDTTGTFKWPFGLAALAAFLAAFVFGLLGKPRKKGEG
jgi:MFS family permease